MLPWTMPKSPPGPPFEAARARRAQARVRAQEASATDFSTGRMVKVSAVKFVPQMMGEGPQRALDYVAYYADAGAQEAAQRNNTTPVDWTKVLADTVP